MQANKVIFALILLPVSRNTMTWLRETPLREVVPFDDCITFHRLLGTLGLLSSLVHTACHMVDFAHEVRSQRLIAVWTSTRQYAAISSPTTSPTNGRWASLVAAL